MTATLANGMDVSPAVLSVPDIDSCIGLMHTLFTLEDRYGLKVEEYIQWMEESFPNRNPKT